MLLFGSYSKFCNENQLWDVGLLNTTCVDRGLLNLPPLGLFCAKNLHLFSLKRKDMVFIFSRHELNSISGDFMWEGMLQGMD